MPPVALQHRGRKRQRVHAPELEHSVGIADCDWAHQEREETKERQRAAGKALYRHLLEQFAVCKVTAKDFAISCFHCAEAGVLGADFRRYAVAPKQSSEGAYQRHLDRVMPEPPPLYELSVPCALRRGRRGQRTVPTSLPHEALAREVAADPAILDQCAATEWPPAYWSHPLVEAAQAAGKRLPMPVALYVDGVRYTSQLAGRADSVIGFWLVNLTSSKRHVLCTLRSRDLCRCGCRGMCTIAPVLDHLAWSFRVLGQGVRPSRRHDGEPWRSADPLGAAQDTALGCTGMLLWLKGDWAEASHTLGLPQVTSANAPCPFCDDAQCRLHASYRSMSLRGVGGTPRPESYYDDCRQACEHRLTLATEQDRQLLLSALRYLKGKRWRGRTVTQSLPRFELLAGDRLLPSGRLQNVGDLADLSLPLDLVFWRPRFDGAQRLLDTVVFPNPLFASDLARSPAMSMA